MDILGSSFLYITLLYIVLLVNEIIILNSLLLFKLLNNVCSKKPADVSLTSGFRNKLGLRAAQHSFPA